MTKIYHILSLSSFALHCFVLCYKAEEVVTTESLSNKRNSGIKEQFDLQQNDFKQLKNNHSVQQSTRLDQNWCATSKKQSIWWTQNGWIQLNQLLCLWERLCGKRSYFVSELKSWVQITLQQRNYLEQKTTNSIILKQSTTTKTFEHEQLLQRKNFLKAESDYKSTLAYFQGLEKNFGLHWIFNRFIK